MLFVQELRDRLTIMSLDEGEYFGTIQQAAAAGLPSGRVYDALILRCAAKVKAQNGLHLEPEAFSRHCSRSISSHADTLVQPSFLPVHGYLRDCAEAAFAIMEFPNGRR